MKAKQQIGLQNTST